MNDEDMASLAKLASALARAASIDRKPNLFVERRSEPRLWCSDLVDIWTKGPKGRWRKFGPAVLEDISASGACIQTESPLTQGETVRVKHSDWSVMAEVRYCIYRDEGYFVGLKLAENEKWADAAFQPKHLIDPSKLFKKEPNEE